MSQLKSLYNAPLQISIHTLLLRIVFVENCKKMKEFGSKGGGGRQGHCQVAKDELYYLLSAVVCFSQIEICDGSRVNPVQGHCP